MTKTIEEAAVGYAADKMCVALGLTPGCINRTDALIPKFCGRDIEEAYEDGENRIMSLPLSGRMTAEEKERVKGIYKEELGMAQHFHLKAKASNDISCRQHYYGLREHYISRIILLEIIFGSDFFKEG